MKKILFVAAVLAGILTATAGNAQNMDIMRDSVAADTIISFDIFERLSVYSQNTGKVTLEGDDIKSIINENKVAKKTLKGYRIRVFKDNTQTARNKAEDTKNNLEKAYPGLPVYRTHQSPNFQIEAGDFRTRDDAEKMLRILLPTYPLARIIIVPINFPPL
jgi:hypothetical protein